MTSTASRLACAILFVLAAAPRDAAAGELELTLHVGQAFPFYEQTFTWDPGPVTSPISGARVEQRGVFTLAARGGIAAGASAAYMFNSHVGLEARIDTADVRVETEGARYRIRADLPAPLPDLDTEVDLGQGEIDLERLRPLSLNLRVASGTRPRLVASAGLSYLPAFRFEARQGVGLAVQGLRLPVDLARVTLAAEALPGDESEGRLGVNGGAGVQFPVGARVRLGVEGRYFHFQKQTIEWGAPRASSPLSAIEQEVVRQVAGNLDPVTFNPRFFQVAATVALGF